MRSHPPPAPRARPNPARPLLKDRAYRELKRLIQTGVFPAGTFLSERQLAVAFHGMLAECLGNGEIRFWMDRCLDKLYRAIHRIFSHASARIRLSVEEHAAVVDALVTGDPDRAADAMKTHLQLAVRGLL